MDPPIKSPYQLPSKVSKKINPHPENWGMLHCAQLILVADPCPMTLHGEKLRADILCFSPDPGTVEGALGFGVKRHSSTPPTCDCLRELTEP